jgi:hypothetical protein
VIKPENLYPLTCLVGADPLVPCEHLRSYLSISGTSPHCTGNFGLSPVLHFVQESFAVIAHRGSVEILEESRVVGA